MQRALMWLNLYGCEAVWHKLENRQKMQAKNAFFVFLGHFWANVRQSHDHIGWATSIPSPSIWATSIPFPSIVPIQGPIPEIFTKKYGELAVLKISVFWIGHFDYFFLLHSHENLLKCLGKQGWVKLLIKLNVTTLFDPDQTFCTRVYLAKISRAKEIKW